MEHIEKKAIVHKDGQTETEIKEYEVKEGYCGKVNKIMSFLLLFLIPVYYIISMYEAETAIDKLVVIGEMVALASLIYISKFLVKQ